MEGEGKICENYWGTCPRKFPIFVRFLLKGRNGVSRTGSDSLVRLGGGYGKQNRSQHKHVTASRRVAETPYGNRAKHVDDNRSLAGQACSKWAGKWGHPYTDRPRDGIRCGSGWGSGPVVGATRIGVVHMDVR